MATINETTTTAATKVTVTPPREGSVWQTVAVFAAVAIAIALPFIDFHVFQLHVVVTDYRLFQLTQVLVYAMAILGLNMLTGFNGQISLGHSAFYAIGAYTTAILLDKTNVPYWATIPTAGVLCLCVGFVFGLPALRLEGFYLALATSALAVATPQLLKYKLLDQWTGGVQGVQVTQPDAPAGIPLLSSQWFYFIVLAWTIVLFLVAVNLLRGRTGRALVAIRDHPLAASTMGVDTATYKATTFGISAMYTGIAGALSALLTQFVSPDSFDPFLSVRFLVGSVVGGVFSITGAFIGGAFIEFLPNIADQLSKAAPQAIYGAVLIALMYLMPSGVMGLIRIGGARLKRVFAARPTK